MRQSIALPFVTPLLLLLAGGSVALAEGPAPARYHMLVDTTWLAAHRNDPGLVILHVGRDRTAYDEAHIPGARFLAWEAIAAPRNGIPNELPPIEALTKTVRGLGLTPESRVVLYDEQTGLNAARAYVALDALGLARYAALLDGHFAKWLGENRPTSKTAPEVVPSSVTPRLRDGVIASLDATREVVRAAADGSGTAPHILDARSAESYAESGHIPGASNVHWEQHLAPGPYPVLRPPAELHALYADAGIAAGAPVLAYCNSGVQASHAYFVLKYLGHEVALYDGSFSEWRAQPDAAVTRGTMP